MAVPNCESWLKIARRKVDRTGVSLPFLSDESTRRTWITTLHKLRAGEPSVTQSAIEHWLSLGHAHGFKERVETAWLAERDHAQPVPWSPLPWLHCGWAGCICYEQPPLYRLSPCTGCWKVYYCGKACQKKYVCGAITVVACTDCKNYSDWNERHREQCVRRKHSRQKKLAVPRAAEIAQRGESCSRLEQIAMFASSS